PLDGAPFKLVVNKDITLKSSELFQAILDGRDPWTGARMNMIGIQANAHVEGFVVQNAFEAIASRGNSHLSPIHWSARNLVIHNVDAGLGIDEGGARDDWHSSSATATNITVDGADEVCYWTNEAGTLDVQNSIASNCPVGYQACDDLGFTYGY